MPVIFVSPAVLDAIDSGATSGDPTLSFYRRKLEANLKAITAIHDHQQFSQFFERYSEALAYLLLTKRGLKLERIAENSDKSPDFRTAASRELFFEVKTLDFAAAPYAHDRHGKSSATKVIDQTKRPGLGSTTSAIRPHGGARTSFEVIREVMPRIERNYKKGQFRLGPTFLVLPLTRTAIQADECSLASWFTQYRRKNTGHLWALAAGRTGDRFLDAGIVVGKLPEPGILRKRAEIAGIIFVTTDWNLARDPLALTKAFQLHGIWNRKWTGPGRFTRHRIEQVKKQFVQVCDAHNDTKDRQRAKLARSCPFP